MKKFVVKRIINPLLGFLKQGIEPEKLALSLAFGVCLGLMPVMGINTLLLTLLALIFKLNIAALQLVNFAVYAFQIALYVPFLKLGQFIFLPGSSDFLIDKLINQPLDGIWDSLFQLWNIHQAGLIVWLIISIPFGFLIYFLSLSFFKKQSLLIKSKSD